MVGRGGVGRDRVTEKVPNREKKLAVPMPTLYLCPFDTYQLPLPGVE